MYEAEKRISVQNLFKFLFILTKCFCIESVKFATCYP